MSPNHKRLELSPSRLPRWWNRFQDDHPNVEITYRDGEVVLTSTNGSIARFRGWYPVAQDVDPLPALLARPATVGVILLRRGGYSLGCFTSFDHDGGGAIASHTSGRRYVQGRTSAGGWSQQRFARRRDNQAQELAQHVVGKAVHVLQPVLTHPDGAGLIVGGDTHLIDTVIAHPRVRAVKTLVRREFFDIPSPRFAVLQTIHARAQTVEVQVSNP